MAGVNDDEVEDMVNFCIEHDFTLRFCAAAQAIANWKMRYTMP